MILSFWDAPVSNSQNHFGSLYIEMLFSFFTWGWFFCIESEKNCNHDFATNPINLSVSYDNKSNMWTRMGCFISSQKGNALCCKKQESNYEFAHAFF